MEQLAAACAGAVAATRGWDDATLLAKATGRAPLADGEHIARLVLGP